MIIDATEKEDDVQDEQADAIHWKRQLYDLFKIHNLIEGFKPKIKRMQNLAAPKTIHISESGVGLLTHNTSEYEMGRLHRPESFVTPSNEAQ